MKRLVTSVFVLLLLLSCTTTSRLIIKNGTDSNVDMYLTAYTKRFKSIYTIIPNKKMRVGEYRNNTFEYTTTPYMFVRTRVVTDSVLYFRGKESGRLSVTEVDTLRIEQTVIDSLFSEELHNNSKNPPKKLILTIDNSLFEKETMKNINGIRLKSKRFINQEAIKK